MCVGVVVDATSITKFQYQRIKKGGGPAVDNLEGFLENGFIFMDKGRFMEQEWMESGSHSTHARDNLQDWVADLQQSGRIKLKEITPDPILRKQLLAFGMSGKDSKYLAAAKQFGAVALVSDDADMFDPKFKTMRPKTRQKKMNERKGRVCRFAQKKLGVVVTVIEDMLSVVPQCSGLCSAGK